MRESASRAADEKMMAFYSEARECENERVTHPQPSLPRDGEGAVLGTLCCVARDKVAGSCLRRSDMT